MASLNLENCLNIPDDFEGYSKTLFNIPKHYEDCVGNVLIPAGLVQVITKSNKTVATLCYGHKGCTSPFIIRKTKYVPAKTNVSSGGIMAQLKNVIQLHTAA